MKKVFCLLAAILISHSSHALLINGSATLDQDNKITIDYLFTANQVDVSSFDLLFDLTLFDNITVSQNPDPLQWDTLVLPSDPFFGEDGLINFLALSSPLAIGATLSGFQVTADFIGTDIPIQFTQDFEVVDPVTFEPLDPAIFGQSADIEVSLVQVNAPPSAILLLLSLAFVFSQRTRNIKGGA